MIEQCKGKDLHKVPEKQLEEDYYSSIKYDGNYVQIDKTGDKVRFFTSGGKEFFLYHISEALVKHNKGIDFTVETEYTGETEGLFGQRGKATTTTFRTNFAKGLPSGESGKEQFIVFDVIRFEYKKIRSSGKEPFSVRLTYMKMLTFVGNINAAAQEFLPFMDIQYALAEIVNAGWEGIMMKSPNHMYLPGKRVNNCIKLKPRLKAVLKCIGTLPEKDNKHLIGKLMLEDEEGRKVNVGSGLNGQDKVQPSKHFIGKEVGIEYERIEKTYVQPVLKYVK